MYTSANRDNVTQANLRWVVQTAEPYNIERSVKVEGFYISWASQRT